MVDVEPVEKEIQLLDANERREIGRAKHHFSVSERIANFRSNLYLAIRTGSLPAKQADKSSGCESKDLFAREV